jgi:membrane associated rhomboid family serine protease
MIICLPTNFETKRRCDRMPLANWVLIGLNIIAFGLSGTMGAGSGARTLNLLGYAFIHADIWHLAVNMWVLWVFGTVLNRRLGNGWYLAVYLGAAVAIGIVGRMIFGVNLIGSSGAVFAVIAACILLEPAGRIEILCLAIFPLSLLIGLFSRPGNLFYWFVRGGRFHVKAVWGILLVPGMELMGLIWSGWNWTNLGHLLGLACGVAAVLLLPRRISMQRPIFQLGYDK